MRLETVYAADSLLSKKTLYQLPVYQNTKRKSSNIIERYIKHCKDNLIFVYIPNGAVRSISRVVIAFVSRRSYGADNPHLLLAGQAEAWAMTRAHNQNQA
jgi:hypothetical protein